MLQRPGARWSLALLLVIHLGCDGGAKQSGNEPAATTDANGAQTKPEQPEQRPAASSCKPGTELLVSGKLVREQTEFTWNEPFVFGPETHAIIRLSWSPAVDDPAKTLVEMDVPATQLPFAFELCGDPAVFVDRGTFYMTANILNHAGTELEVGDLVSEYRNEIDGKPTFDYEIKVSGLERCGQPNSGGFCINASSDAK